MKNATGAIEAGHAEPSALVLQRLSIVPQGDTENALERADHFVTAVQEFVDGSEALVTAAENYTVDDQISSQTADIIQDELKRDIKEWNDRRLAVTRPIDDLKAHLTGLPKPGLDNRQKAVAIYQGKISTYQRRVREEEAKAQREAERLLREEKERLEAEARKQDDRARNLKTAAAQQRAADEAARLREQAQFVPESVAVATSGPALSASTTAEVWEGFVPLCDACKAADAKRPDPKRECPHNRRLAVQTLLARWEEWGSIIEFRKGSSRDGKQGMDDLARKHKDTLQLPGFEFRPRDSFRSKGYILNSPTREDAR